MRTYPLVLLAALACNRPVTPAPPPTPVSPPTGQAIRDAGEIIVAWEHQRDPSLQRGFPAGTTMEFQLDGIAIDRYEKDKAVARVNYYRVHEGKRGPPCQIAITYRRVEARVEDFWKMESSNQGMKRYNEENCYPGGDRQSSR